MIRPFQTTSSTTAGGVLTSVTDLMRYARFHLGDGGRHAERAPTCRKPRLVQMQTAQVPQARHRRRDGRRLAPATARRRRRRWRARRHAQRPLPADASWCRRAASRSPCSPITSDGWRLVQDVEQAILRRFAGVGAGARAAIGHRGVNEAMNLHSTPLAQQPELDDVSRRLPAPAGRRGGRPARRRRARRGHRQRPARRRDRVLRVRRRLCGRAATTSACPTSSSAPMTARCAGFGSTAASPTGPASAPCSRRTSAR